MLCHEYIHRCFSTRCCSGWERTAVCLFNQPLSFARYMCALLGSSLHGTRWYCFKILDVTEEKKKKVRKGHLLMRIRHWVLFTGSLASHFFTQVLLELLKTYAFEDQTTSGLIRMKFNSPFSLLWMRYFGSQPTIKFNGESF